MVIHLSNIKLNCPCSEKWNFPNVIIIYIYECAWKHCDIIYHYLMTYASWLICIWKDK